MTLNRYISLALAGGFILLPLTTVAADDSQNAGKTSGKVGMKDEAFIRKAAQDGMTEVKLGQLADQKAKRDDVKKFGEQMVTDHGKANDELKSLALLKGITLSDQLDAVHAGIVDRLSQLEQDQFDKAYIDQMIKDHQNAVNEFKGEMKVVADPELKVFVAKTLPVLKTHLQHVQRIATGAPQ